MANLGVDEWMLGLIVGILSFVIAANFLGLGIALNTQTLSIILAVEFVFFLIAVMTGD